MFFTTTFVFSISNDARILNESNQFLSDIFLDIDDSLISEIHECDIEKPKYPGKKPWYRTKRWYNKHHPQKRKPVIYLYGDGVTEIAISFKPKGETTYTYPEYNNGWRVTANAFGNLKEVSTGKNYPYLFWEGIDKNLDFIRGENSIEGFIINTDSSSLFLENILNQIGLNEKEKTDFITFWVPELIKSEFAFVQFLIDEQYNQNISELEIIPKPASEKKVFMLYSPLEKPTSKLKIIPQAFTFFQRHGLIVVEWGGAKIENTNLNF